MNTEKSSTPGERMVVFVGGFDPRGSKHYQQLMCKQAQQQLSVDGCVYEVGARAAWNKLGDDPVRHSQWSVQTLAGVTTDYVFYEWSDVVRQHWGKRWLHVIASALRSYREIAQISHDWQQLHQQKPYTLWTLFYPLIYFALTLLLSVGIGLSTFMCWPHILGALLGLSAFAGIWLLSRKLDEILHVTWLLRIFKFAVDCSQAPQDPLERRHQHMAQALAQRLREQPHLHLTIAGFSVGSAMSVGLIHALREQLDTQQWQRVQWLTLGNCIPLFSLQRGAETLREQLASLARDPHLFWADISAPSDSVSFGVCDLMRLALGHYHQSGQEPFSGPRHMCSPRFHTLFTPQRYRRLSRNKMRMHFQYLMAAELPGAYDYLALITHDQGFKDYVLKRLVR